MKTMKKLVITLVFLLLSTLSAAQSIIVVPQSSSLVWDYDINADYIAEFGIYLSRTAGIVPDGNPDFRVAWPGVPPIDPAALYWTIDATVPNGRNYAVVTAIGNDVDATESGPSNEVTFVIIGPPGNVQVIKEE